MIGLGGAPSPSRWVWRSQDPAMIGLGSVPNPNILGLVLARLSHR